MYAVPLASVGLMCCEHATLYRTTVSTYLGAPETEHRGEVAAFAGQHGAVSVHRPAAGKKLDVRVLHRAQSSSEVSGQGRWRHGLLEPPWSKCETVCHESDRMHRWMHCTINFQECCHLPQRVDVLSCCVSFYHCFTTLLLYFGLLSAHLLHS